MEKLLIIFSFIIFLFGCERGNPNDGDKSSTVPELKQIAVYNTAVPEPSGLAWNTKKNTLFTVSDANSTVYEIDFTGKILNSFIIPSSDLEGIAFTSNCDTFYVTEETNQKITKYLLNGTKLSSFSVNVATNPKNALEGVTVDENNHVFVLNEKSPCMLLEFVNGKEIYRKEMNYSSDCSDIFYEYSTRAIWMVSDESKSVMKLSRSGELLARYSIPFVKGEGIVVINDKIYIFNDSDNKLYVFEKPQ